MAWHIGRDNSYCRASEQGCGSATCFRDCRTKKKTKKLSLTWSRVCPSLPQVYSLETHKLCFADYTKCRSHAPDLNMDICLYNPLFFLLHSMEQILQSTLVVALRSSLPGNTRYCLQGDCTKISLFLFSIFPLP